MIKDMIVKPASSYEEALIDLEFTDMTKPVESYIFSLERSEHPEGPWIYISDEIVLDTMTDKTVDRRNFRTGVSLYYRVIVRDGLGNKVGEMIKSLLIDEKDHIALTIEANYQRYLDAQDLTEFTLLRRSKTSEYCECFNDVRMESEDPNCPICGGTGRIEGYRKGPDIQITIVNPISQETLVKELFGEITIDTTAARAWTTGRHLLVTEDIVVNQFSGEVFEIESVAYSKRRDYVIRQAITMSKKEPGDPIYKYLEAVI